MQFSQNLHDITNILELKLLPRSLDMWFPWLHQVPANAEFYLADGLLRGILFLCAENSNCLCCFLPNTWLDPSTPKTLTWELMAAPNWPSSLLQNITKTCNGCWDNTVKSWLTPLLCDTIHKHRTFSVKEMSLVWRQKWASNLCRRRVLASDQGAGNYFVILVGRYLIFSIFPFLVNSKERSRMICEAVWAMELQ